MSQMPCVLTIAASDSSGAAGVQADLKTYEARGVFGTSALTAITAQNSRRISGVQFVEPSFVAAQIEAVLADSPIRAIKTGLLFRAEIIQAVAHAIRETPAVKIIDPVLVAGDGRRLVDDAALDAYRRALFPMALIITPNLDEATILSGSAVDSPEAMRAAAQQLVEWGPRFVLVKGGHLDGGTTEILDVLYDGQRREFHEFRAERLPIDNPRGAGCSFASCVAAEVAKGRDVPTAVGIAKRYVSAALLAASDWHIGQGRAALYHGVGRAPLFD